MTRPATLPDGTTVCSSSEAWRHHCEALTVCRMPTQEARRKHLEAVEQKRGQPARQQLEETARALWCAARDARTCASS